MGCFRTRWWPALVMIAATACGTVQEAAPDAAPVPKSTAPKPKPAGTTPKAQAVPSTAGRPVVTKRTVTETRRIPFRKVTVDDPALAQGRTVVTTRGVTGRRLLTFELTLVNGVRTARRLVRQQVVRAPVDQVTSVGSKVAEVEPEGSCDPNYSGGCVPVASDVDCAGGSGNGPEYVDGPVTVVGEDVYGLDGNSDGIGCED